MKPPRLIHLATPLFAVLLSHCVVVEEGGPSSSSPAPNVSGSPQESQAIYDRGYQGGLKDGRGGLSRTPSRYDGTYPAAESDAFSMGYEKGYNVGIR